LWILLVFCQVHRSGIEQAPSNRAITDAFLPVDQYNGIGGIEHAILALLYSPGSSPGP
jgi:leucyl-tRNA synthetase